MTQQKDSPTTPAVPDAPATPETATTQRGDAEASVSPTDESTEELGGPKGPEPTRFGDWERNGRCSDF